MHAKRAKAGRRLSQLLASVSVIRETRCPDPVAFGCAKRNVRRTAEGIIFTRLERDRSKDKRNDRRRYGGSGLLSHVDKTIEVGGDEDDVGLAERTGVTANRENACRLFLLPGDAARANAIARLSRSTARHEDDSRESLLKATYAICVRSERDSWSRDTTSR